MQIEMDFYGRCNDLEYNQDHEQLLIKNDNLNHYKVHVYKLTNYNSFFLLPK